MRGDSASRDQELSELCRLAQQGDKAAYTELLGEVERIVRGYLQHRVGARDSVDDIIQEILISLHHGLHTYIPGRSFSGWMFAIARNRLCDFLRRSKRMSKEISTDVEKLDEFAFEPESPSDVEQVYQHLLDQIKFLPPRYAEAVRATKLEGNSIREVSAALGVSEASLKVTIHRAYKLLRQRMAVKT